MVYIIGLCQQTESSNHFHSLIFSSVSSIHVNFKRRENPHIFPLHNGVLRIDQKTLSHFAQFASVCGLANGKVERRRRDAGTEPERNDRRQTAGGSTPIIRLKPMPLVTSALSAKRNRRGREGNRADHQPVKYSRKARWSRRGL
jgi:hypothetical protein